MTSPEDINNVDHFVVAFIVGPIVIQAIFYGIYTALFCYSMYIFRKRSHEGHKVILIGTILLFFLCTAECVAAYPAARFSNVGYHNLGYVLSNFVADTLLLYRCYVIWNHRKLVICVPTILILASAALGGDSSSFNFGPFGSAEVLGYTWDSRVALFISLATNVLLTSLSAVRIWWISREIRKTLEPKMSQKYNSAIALIIESGLIYCVTLAAYLISLANREPGSAVSNLSKSDITSRVLFGALTQIVGIVPTLIIVRVGLGISVERTQTDMVSTIQFNHQRIDEAELTIQNGTMSTV